MAWRTGGVAGGMLATAPGCRSRGYGPSARSTKALDDGRDAVAHRHVTLCAPLILASAGELDVAHPSALPVARARRHAYRLVSQQR